MIGKTLQAIIEEKGTNINELAKKIGVSNQTLYSIVKRDNMKIDFEVLLKICSVLDVSIERFYADYIASGEVDEGGVVDDSEAFSMFADLSCAGKEKVLEYIEMLRMKENS